MMSTIGNPFGLTQEALDACAREPIHIPGSIQPQGVLLTLSEPDLLITQVSINSADLVGREPSQLLGQPLTALLAQQQVDALLQELNGVAAGTVIARELKPGNAPAPLLGLAHRYGGLLLLELLADESLAGDVQAFQYLMPRGTVPAEEGWPSLAARPFAHLAVNLAIDTPLRNFAQRVADEVRELTGYDRVMIYQFDDAGNGEVVAEARAATIEPFLGLCYPAADIPPQARLLYLRSRVRALSDVAYQPVPLLPRVNPATGKETDLSYCLLRSFSPVHLEYLHNMGVRATLTVSIVEQDRLWGLIACHHYSPKWPTQAMRLACDMLSEGISMQVTLRAHYLRMQATTRAHAIQHRLLRALANQTEWRGALANLSHDLMSMVEADGVAIAQGETVLTYGAAPDAAWVRALVTWLQTTVPSRVLITDALGALNPSFAALAPLASGLIAMEVMRTEAAYVLWFRREVVQTVTWGGNPAEKLAVNGGVARLRPRASFAAWVTEMRGKARPWPGEVQHLVEALRAMLVEVVLELMTARHSLASLDLQRIKRAVEATGEPVAITDANGDLLFVNRAFTRLLGYTRDELAAQGGIDTLVANPVLAAQIAAAGQSLDGRWQGELDVRASNGDLVPVALLLDSVSDEHNQPIGQIRLYGDLRARRRADEERRRLDEQLLQTQKLESLGVLAGGIAHDFNNLLTAMLGHANLALLELAPESPARESILQIELAAQRAADLSRQMLAYSGRGHFVIQQIDLNQIVTEMAHLLRTAITQGAALRFNLVARPTPIEADATQIRQVVMNLITNAADAVGERGVITLTTRTLYADADYLAAFKLVDPLPEGMYVSLEVSDTGIGMDSATIARIFEPFFTTKFTGRGLGLSAVQGIVRGHRGAIRVYSQIGQGTTFCVLLPAVGAATQQASPPAALAANGRGRTVLVIDDDAAVRMFARRMLERTGFTVLEARDGIEGTATFTTVHQELSLVLLDLTMPQQSGTETFQRLHQINPEVPVVLCSGYSEEEATSSFAGRGLAGFVQKPFRVADLLTVIQRVLGDRSG